MGIMCWNIILAKQCSLTFLQKVQITSFDRENFKISAIGFGETFDLEKHPQGTEVKAITYSNMQVHENDGKTEIFVIIDI
jgi:SHS2 domain-containing protein